MAVLPAETADRLVQPVTTDPVSLDPAPGAASNGASGASPGLS